MGGMGCRGRKTNIANITGSKFLPISAMVDAHVLFMAWCSITDDLRNSKLRKEAKDKIESLEKVSNKLDTLSRTERLVGDRALSHSLMVRAWLVGRKRTKPLPDRAI